MRIIRQSRRPGCQDGPALTQLVLGYLIAQPFPTVPVIGLSNIAQLMDSMTAADVMLSMEDAAYLSRDGHSRGGPSTCPRSGPLKAL
ncbi:MAG: aldo/keto reductase [Thermoflexales bacterium]